MKRHRAIAGPGGMVDVLRDLMLGGRHSRHTVIRFGVSLPTADRWLKEIAAKIPGVRKVREGKTSWFEFAFAHTRRSDPTWPVIARRELLRCNVFPGWYSTLKCELPHGHRGRHRSGRTTWPTTASAKRRR